MDYHSVFYTFQHMWFGISIFFLFLFFMNKTRIFRNALTEKAPSFSPRMLFFGIFTMLGLCGTYWNIHMEGGLVNFRAVGPIVAGIVAGPVVGGATGIAVGLHRVISFTTTANELHGLLSFLQGLAAGLLSVFIRFRPRMWLRAFFAALCIEAGSGGLLLWLAALSPEETSAVKETLLPIIITNALAVALFISVLEDTIRREDYIRQATTRSVFQFVRLLLNALSDESLERGLRKTAEILPRFLPGISCAAVSRDGCVAEGKLASEDFAGKGNVLVSSVAARGRELAALILRKPEKNDFTPFEKEFVDGIRQVLETVAEFQQLKTEKELHSQAEIRILQAQINPHFLFNTLNTISYYCMSNPDIAVELLGNLSDYYRHSLSNPASLISLSEELEHIKAYLALERARFSDRLRIIWKVHSGHNLRIPPLLLQPLVENALLHGILPLDRKGTVIIGVIEHSDYWKLYVCDDGCGIGKEEKRKLLLNESPREKIGLINVHRRLLSLYGPQSGLKISSWEGKGTIVSFKIKKEEIGNGANQGPYRR